jgi:hypothetical protein
MIGRTAAREARAADIAKVSFFWGEEVWGEEVWGEEVRGQRFVKKTESAGKKPSKIVWHRRPPPCSLSLCSLSFFVLALFSGREPPAPSPPINPGTQETFNRAEMKQHGVERNNEPSSRGREINFRKKHLSKERERGEAFLHERKGKLRAL